MKYVWQTSTREIVQFGFHFDTDLRNALLGLITFKEFLYHDDEVLRLIIGMVFIKFKLVIRTPESVRRRKAKLWENVRV